MRPLSLDLRERIVTAYEANEGSHAEIGRRFSVSGHIVGKLVQQKRTLGTLEPQVHRRRSKTGHCGRDARRFGEARQRLSRRVRRRTS